jgi:anti-anti-sigma factor
MPALVLIEWSGDIRKSSPPYLLPGGENTVKTPGEFMATAIRIERKDGILIVSPSCRLDEFGSIQLDEAIGREIHDDDRSVVIDMEKVPYLSNAGIRVFVGWKRRTQERNGRFALTRVQQFPWQVLHMSGYLPSFALYDSLSEAIAACHSGDARSTTPGDPAHPSISRDQVRFIFEEESSGPAVLHVSGTLAKVLSSDITAGDIRSLRFRDATYSLGLGALGGSVAEALPFLGEMITLHGSLVFVPTDGHMMPDFFTPAEDTGEVTIFSGFNVALQGPFHDVVLVECERPEGVTLAELYRHLFSLARERNRPSSSVITLVLWAIAGGVRSSEIRKAPIRENAPANHKTIMDPDNFTEWNAITSESAYKGDTMVSFGYGIDFSRPHRPGDEDMVQSLFYRHPENRDADGQYLHNHGVIFRNIPWDPGRDLSSQIEAIVRDGEFVDMRHLLDDTRILHAKVGISYISRVIEEDH